MPRAPRSRHLLALVLAVVAVVAATAPNGATATTTAKPNIVLLILDDMAWSTFTPRLMPATYSRLIDRGVLFERTYIDTPMCCPSRSQILTGLYEHHTGVDGNNVPYTGSTIVQALHDRGYRTMLAGKYLNSLSCRPRREFDRWVCAGKGAPAPGKVDPWLEVDGDWTKFQGYQADVLGEQLVNFVQATPTDTPFFAMWTPVSPHLPVQDDRYASMAVDPVRTPSYDLDTMHPSWPMWMRRAPLSGAERADLDTKHEQMAQANRSLDDAVAKILDGLGGRLDNTMVVLLSDNGYEYGEHRRAGKVDPFEESVRVPMVISYPPAHDPSTGSVTQALAQNVDLAPTIADLVGFPWRSDGVSLEPVLSGTKGSVRDAALIEYGTGEKGLIKPPVGFERVNARPEAPTYRGIVTADWKYVELITGERMLFDLSRDPYETTNLAGSPGSGLTEDELAASLRSLVAPPPTATTIVTGPRGTWWSPSARFTFFSQSRFASFECRLTRNGVIRAWHQCDGGVANEGGLDRGDWVFEVRATDEFGNVDATPAFSTFTVPHLGPTVQIVAAPAARISRTSATFSFASPLKGATFECRMESSAPGTWKACQDSVKYSNLAEGLWDFRVRAKDPTTGGWTRPPVGRIVTVDTTGPDVRAALRPPQFSGTRGASFIVVPREAVSKMTCSLDDGSSFDCSDGAVSFSGLDGGWHAFDIRATDVLGNQGSTTTFDWKVDLTAPDPEIVDGPAKVTTSSSASFALTSTDEPEWFVCSLDGGVEYPCGVTPSVSDLGVGAHVFDVRAVDRALNVSDPVSWSWTVAA